MFKALSLTVLFVAMFVSTPVFANEKGGLRKGDSMVDFGMRRADLEKGQLSGLVWLSDFVGKKEAPLKKQLLILSFFANWCPPCIEEMPFLQKMYTKYKDKGLMILGISFRAEGEVFKDAFEKSLKILKEKGVTYPVLFDRFTNRNQLLYLGPKAVLPCLVFIDSNGKIVEKIQGEDSHDFKKIEQIILKRLGG